MISAGVAIVFIRFGSRYFEPPRRQDRQEKVRERAARDDEKPAGRGPLGVLGVLAVNPQSAIRDRTDSIVEPRGVRGAAARRSCRPSVHKLPAPYFAYSDAACRRLLFAAARGSPRRPVPSIRRGSLLRSSSNPFRAARARRRRTTPGLR